MTDEHDTRKARIETEMIKDAEDRVIERCAARLFKGVNPHLDFAKMNRSIKSGYVNLAEAVIEEYRRPS